jgi:transcriptional regulator with XRE-family HTH domain
VTASRKPFPEALRELMEAKGLSFRAAADLTRSVDPKGRGLSHGYIGHLARGAARPTIENMEVIARALGEEPTYFREYREHLAALEARRLVTKVGLDRVMEALRQLDRPS